MVDLIALANAVLNGKARLIRAACACPGEEGTRNCNFGRLCGVLSIGGLDAGQIQMGLAHPYVCGATSCPQRRRIKSVCDASQSFSMEASVCLPCDVPQKWFGLEPRQ